MSTQHFTRTVRVPVPVHELFAWHERPGAFARLAPPWDAPRVLEATGGIRDGAKVRLQVHTGPVATEWRLEHRDYIANEQFVDVMQDGPFAEWVHTHRFTANGPLASVLEDSIRYALPLGALGQAVAGGYSADTLARVFSYRHELTVADLARHAANAARPRMRIAITGASGFIGTQLSAFLSTGGHDVIRIGRGPVVPGKTDISWNPERGQLDPRALEGIDAVVHLAGASIGERWSSAHRAALLTSRVEGTSLLSHTLAQLTKKPAVLVSGSAIGIYGNAGDRPLDEFSAHGRDYLADVCVAWEAATAPAQKAGIRVVHARTGIVQGAAGGALAKQLPLFRYGVGGPLSDGNQWVSPIALDDEIGALHFCLMHESLSGPVNLVSPTPVTNAEFTATLAHVLGRPAFARVPAFALRLALGEEMANLTVLASQRVLPKRLLEAGFQFRLPTLDAMLRFECGIVSV
ncbi:MAG: TIGR01777 family protein [Gemmatimonadaceae bacterium]|nr:TIGR01777 family protein [Gemmatimonadaceae bacterium]